MTVYVRFLSLLIAGSLLAIAQADEPAPHWLWHRDTTADVAQAAAAESTCRLQHTLRLDSPVQSATLKLAADFCSATVHLNGKPLAHVEPYCQAIEIDATAALATGNNRIEIDARACPGPSAVALSLALVNTDGSRQTIVTDERWQSVADSGNQPAVSMGPVPRPLWALDRRSSAVSPLENYEQWRQALDQPPAGDAAAFWTAPGFEISLVRRAEEGEGSWVSMAFDPNGRLTIAREDEGLLRMTLAADRRSISRVESIDSTLQECRGLLYAYDSLYANANNSKGLYRLRDTDGDDHFDEVKLLREFPGSVGHGRNDLALGPDGLIYSIHGDSVDLPAKGINDHTSPLREARRGKASKEGHVIRTDRDGKKWELVCAGLRNPFGIAFNAAGDLFTYDADAEFDTGTPWYRPTRVLQLLTGADYGWRGVTGKWPPYYADHADNAQPTLDIGRGSPTAVLFGTETSFPPDYRRALFILDWTYGRILAVHLAPRGAGYRAQADTFLQGRPLNVTDLAGGPDGALYIITGGRKTQSALYRIAYTRVAYNELAHDDPPISAHEKACQRHAEHARSLRLSLERRHDDARERIAFAWPHLGADDPIIRHAARVCLERQPLAMWQRQTLAEQDTATALTALLALARAAQPAAPPLLDRLLQFNPAQLTAGQTLSLLQGYSLRMQHAPDAIPSRKAAIIKQLDSVFPHPAAEYLHVTPLGTGANIQRELARLLAELGSLTAVNKTTSSLLSGPVQEDRLQGLFALRNVHDGWTPETRRAYFNTLNDGSKFVAGEGMPRFLTRIREEALGTLSEAEKADLADLLTPAAEPAESTAAPTSRPLVKHWTLDDFATHLAGARTGDPARGAQIFRDALCIRCHQAHARGPAVGPDLTHVAGRFSRRDMLESILTPSKVVAENYRNVQISTRDGRVVVGRVVIAGDYRSQTLKVATEPLAPATIVEIDKRDIEASRESETSPMPAGLLDSFELADILDLLAFLETGARVKTPQP